MMTATLEQLHADLDETMTFLDKEHERKRAAAMQTAEVWKRLNDAGIGVIRGFLRHGSITIAKADLPKLRVALGCPLRVKEKSPDYWKDGDVCVELQPLAYKEMRVRYSYTPKGTDRCKVVKQYGSSLSLVCKT